MTRRLLAFVLTLLPLAATAQSSRFGFEYRPGTAQVRAGATTLPLAWAGGLNSPQFSPIDLNGDGQQDLFVFERMTNRVLTFLNVPNLVGGRRWQYAPEYASRFPADLRNWALLRDYDCDGRPDLWTQEGSGDVRVFRNAGTAGGPPAFVLASPMLTFFNTPINSGNIRLNPYDIPAIHDIDGDGRLDIMAFDFSTGTYLKYYRNTSSSCGGLQYREESDYWGGISVCMTCTGYATGGDPCRPGGIQHTGGFGLLLQDLDGDQDMDLLLGRDGCPEWVALRNTGTPQVAATNGSSLLTTLPNGIGTVSLENYPVGYSFDATLDGRPDIVVASGLLDNSDRARLRDNVLLLEGTGTGTVPSYMRRPGSFLQGDMLDVSEGAATAFGDIDGDGLKDMLLANASDQYGAILTDANYRATLAYYRNTGTATQPVFTLINGDYLGLSARNFTGLRPALADLNGDGALDLAYTARYVGGTSVLYHLNSAPAGQPVAYNGSQLNDLKTVSGYAGDTPCFADVDGDGHLDLLLGTNLPGGSGSLHYYRRNPALPFDQSYSLVSNDFGSIRNAANGRPGNLAAAVADVDGDGTPDLLTVDNTGELHLFASFRSQTAPFMERTDLVYNPLSQQYEESRWGEGSRVRHHLALADVTADGAPELFAGLETGGVVLYGPRNRVLNTRAKAENLPLQVYPNPASGQVNVETTLPSRVVVRDLLGRIVVAASGAQRRQQIDIRGLAAGVYLLEATAADGRRGVQRMEVR